ncbi:DUF3667 domain-containing protein [Pseudidiomarina atlantica]|uniref:DUF3667 domain-containing protein n=1 Tax=Pseudidiomarina atlantica TaxID=1517416 RepID=UPI0009DF42D6|nr:DUF3667 domain-containing protein [Pseudidiomarina atlantica]
MSAETTHQVVVSETTTAPTENNTQRCKNCDSELLGEFCHICGQQDRHYIRSIFAVVGDLMGEISHWDSRFYRTMIALFMRPGFLTQEFVKGRHASFVPPLRLYFFVSLFSFLILTSLIDFTQIKPTDELTDKQQANASISVPTVPTDTSEAIDGLRVSVPFATPEQENMIEEKVKYLLENPKLLVQRLVSLAPQMMLIMLPFWALFLKLMYPFSGRFYLEHLSAALHTHAFLLLSLSILTILSRGSDYITSVTGWLIVSNVVDWIENILLVWMVSYMLFTLKIVYEQTWGWTLTKFALCGIGYTLLLTTAFILMVFIGILTA